MLDGLSLEENQGLYRLGDQQLASPEQALAARVRTQLLSADQQMQPPLPIDRGSRLGNLLQTNNTPTVPDVGAAIAFSTYTLRSQLTWDRQQIERIQLLSRQTPSPSTLRVTLAVSAFDLQAEVQVGVGDD